MHEGLADHLLEDAVVAEATEGRQTVAMFTQGVEQRVQEQVATFQEEYGDDVRAIGGDAIAKARSFAAAKRSLLDPSYDVGHTEREGAAAWYEPGTGRTAFSFTAMDPHADQGYWERVRRHEEVHQGQAYTFNSGVLIAAIKLTLSCSTVAA